MYFEGLFKFCIKNQNALQVPVLAQAKDISSGTTATEQLHQPCCLLSKADIHVKSFMLVCQGCLPLILFLDITFLFSSRPGRSSCRQMEMPSWWIAKFQFLFLSRDDFKKAIRGKKCHHYHTKLPQKVSQAFTVKSYCDVFLYWLEGERLNMYIYQSGLKF